MSSSRRATLRSRTRDARWARRCALIGDGTPWSSTRTDSAGSSATSARSPAKPSVSASRRCGSRRRATIRSSRARSRRKPPAAARRGHVGGGGVPPQSDGHGADRVGSRRPVRWQLPARPRHAGEGAHRAPVLHRVRPSRWHGCASTCSHSGRSSARSRVRRSSRSRATSIRSRCSPTSSPAGRSTSPTSRSRSPE